MEMYWPWARVRDERGNMFDVESYEFGLSLADAKKRIKDWKKEYGSSNVRMAKIKDDYGRYAYEEWALD